MTRFHARTAALAAAALLAGGCFDHAVPAGRDVVARTPAEAESLRDSVTFLDFHEAGLAAFPEGLGAYPKLRRLSVQGQKQAAAVPASIAEAKGLVELDLIATGVKDLPPEVAALPALTGNVGKPGGGAGVSGHVVQHEGPRLPELSNPYRPKPPRSRPSAASTSPTTASPNSPPPFAG